MNLMLRCETTARVEAKGISVTKERQVVEFHMMCEVACKTMLPRTIYPDNGMGDPIISEMAYSCIEECVKYAKDCGCRAITDTAGVLVMFGEGNYHEEMCRVEVIVYLGRRSMRPQWLRNITNRS